MSTATVSADGPLAREARLRPRFAGVALVAGVLLLAAAAVQMTGPHTSVTEATVDLVYANKRAGLDILSAAINTVGSLAIAAVLVFLFDAARARNPQAPSFVRVLAIVGAVLASVASLLYAVLLAQKAHQFVTTGDQTYMEAHQLTGSGGLVVLQLVGLLGALLVALSLVLVSLQAMRVGLLTRFMGYLGMFAGALVLFQLTPLPVVETYWLVALAVLFAGRWPTGQPLAWRSGQAERWPSAQSLREQRLRAAGARGDETPLRGRRAGRAAGRPAADGSARSAAKGNGANPAGADAVRAAGPPAVRTGAKRKRKHKR